MLTYITPYANQFQPASPFDTWIKIMVVVVAVVGFIYSVIKINRENQ